MGPNVWTAEQLEQMSPAERHAIFETSIITDLNDVPPEFLDRVRTRAERLIAARDSTEE